LAAKCSRLEATVTLPSDTDAGSLSSGQDALGSDLINMFINQKPIVATQGGMTGQWSIPAQSLPGFLRFISIAQKKCKARGLAV